MTGRISEQDGWCRIGGALSTWTGWRSTKLLIIASQPTISPDVSHEADAGLVGLFFADQPKMHERHFMGEV